MRQISFLFIISLLLIQSLFGQKIPPFNNIGKEILFVDTLLNKKETSLKIRELNATLLKSDDVIILTKTNYNLAICYASKIDTQNTCLYLNNSLRLSPAFHSLILTDSDFKFLYLTPCWNEIVHSIDSIHLALNPLIKEKQLSLELYHIFLKDQQSRGLGIKRKDAMYNYDAENLEKVEKIIEKYGWPTFSMVGRTAAKGAFLVIQHANPEIQKKYYQKLSDAVHQNEADKESFALLTDRISIHMKGYQIYGTQVFRRKDKLTDKLGEYLYFPIKDEQDVDRRRKEMGLIPLKQYFEFYGIKYPSEMP